jgi:hypothetical protein
MGDVAMPLELVEAVTVVDPPKLAPAPVEGAVKVTVALLTGLPPKVTVACNALPKAAPTVAL